MGGGVPLLGFPGISLESGWFQYFLLTFTPYLRGDDPIGWVALPTN